MFMSIGKLMRATLWAGALVVASQAHAQATRTWISGTGDDVNPCSRTAPCKTFAGAISKTAEGGEIDTMDPGGFGAVTITKSITLASDGAGTAGILVAGTNGITVNVPTGSTVYLRKLVLEGLSTVGSSLSGVRVINGDVHIDDCVIHGFTGTNGTDNPGAGISTVASTTSRIFVTHTKIYGNNVGVYSNATASSPIALVDTIIDKNINFGIQGIGVNAVFSLHDSVVTGSAVGISAPSPAKVNSYGTNLLTGVATGTTLTPAALR